MYSRTRKLSPYVLGGGSVMAVDELGGGDFASGFLAGFAGSIAGSVMSSSQFSDVFGKPGQDMGIGQLTMRTVIAGVVGGTAAELGGGKFANGAITAAIQHLFNAEGPGLLEEEIIHEPKDWHGDLKVIVVDRSVSYEEAQGVGNDVAQLNKELAANKANYRVAAYYSGSFSRVMYNLHNLGDRLDVLVHVTHGGPMSDGKQGANFFGNWIAKEDVMINYKNGFGNDPSYRGRVFPVPGVNARVMETVCCIFDTNINKWDYKTRIDAFNIIKQ